MWKILKCNYFLLIINWDIYNICLYFYMKNVIRGNFKLYVCFKIFYEFIIENLILYIILKIK